MSYQKEVLDRMAKAYLTQFQPRGINALKPAQQRNVWARGTRSERLAYCDRQIALLHKWFVETRDGFFSLQIGKWETRKATV